MFVHEGSSGSVLVLTVNRTPCRVGKPLVTPPLTGQLKSVVVKILTRVGFVNQCQPFWVLSRFVAAFCRHRCEQYSRGRPFPFRSTGSPHSRQVESGG